MNIIICKKIKTLVAYSSTNIPIKASQPIPGGLNVIVFFAPNIACERREAAIEMNERIIHPLSNWHSS
jgi:hypothetical protein